MRLPASICTPDFTCSVFPLRTAYAALTAARPLRQKVNLTDGKPPQAGAFSDLRAVNPFSIGNE